MNENNIPRQVSGYHLEKFDGELVLYHFDKAQVVYLNETATLIWQLFDGQRSLGKIKRLLQEVYPGAADRITQEFRAAVEQFLGCGAIEFI